MVHHIALVCKNLGETHHFYEDLLGFPLVHAEVQHSKDGGWMKHVFYDVGDGSCIAFFDLHGVGEPDELRTAISSGLGLTRWANHIALKAEPGQVAEVRTRLADAAVPLYMEVDHGWCQSIYVTDPNGILIELCVDTPGFTPDPDEARRILEASALDDLVA